MAYFDLGFMYIQGIGCDKNVVYGLDLIKKGNALVKTQQNDDWFFYGSATDCLEAQTVDLNRLFIRKAYCIIVLFIFFSFYVNVLEKKR